jgi:hypothetical protein
MDMDSDNELDNVPLAFHGVYRETFMGDDSDEEEFEGFTNDDIQLQVQDAQQHQENASDSEDSDSESEFHDKNWFDGDRNATDYPNLPYTGQPGLRVQLPEHPTVLDFVSLFITEDMYVAITEETNR